MISNANDLTERLRRRLETERQAIEELTASELERLGENSRRVASNALRTIEADTAVATGRMRALLLKAWLRPLVVGLSLWPLTLTHAVATHGVAPVGGILVVVELLSDIFGIRKVGEKQERQHPPETPEPDCILLQRQS